MTQVALVQVASPNSETPAERIARVEEWMRGVDGVDAYLFPELWSTGYFSFDQYEERAEDLDGPTVRMGRRLARRTRAMVHLGSIVERGADGRMHNTTVVIDPSGSVVQTYRKIHVFGYESLEARLLSPGTSLGVVDSPLGALASITCYDLRFPGLWQQLSDRGAETVAIPAAWPAARSEHWRLLTQARAVEHQCFVLATNSCGHQRGVELAGASRVVDPWGRIVAECGAEEEVLVADIDPSAVAAVRAEFPVIADRLADYVSISSDNGAEK